MIVHIVCFKIEDNSSKEENLSKMKKLLEELPSKIPQIIDFEVGLNYNESDAAFDVSLYSTFNSKEDLNAYAIHPDHLVVVNFIKTIATDRVVVDYEK